jgi:hypothetical protein
MCRRTTLLFATTLVLAGSALAAPVTPFAPAAVSRAAGWAVQPYDSGLILVQRRGGGAVGGGAQRPAGMANRGGGFNSNDFHRNVSNSSNWNANRGANVNANRNVNVAGGGGGCCYGNYSSGPSWGGVAAGVAVGAMVGAAASSPRYAAPPPYYPPGYVAPPPY